MKFISTLIAVATLATAGASFAADRQLHLRGEVTAAGAGELTIVDRQGVKTTVQLPEKAQVLDVSRSSQAAIQENSFLGIAAAPASDGKIRATGVMIFPEAARGMNEGHYPWDNIEQGTMTNATVAKVVKKSSSTELEMRFGGRTQQVMLDKATIYGQFVPGERKLLTVGAKVMVIGAEGADGKVHANAVLVGRDGFMPPL